MTVKELIEELKKFDPNTEVRIQAVDPTDWVYQNEIEGIYETSSNWESDWDEDGEGHKVLVIDAGNV